jgi:hypothetical protein
MSNRTESRELRQRGAQTLAEMGQPDTDVEVVTNAGLTDAAELEAFMNEEVAVFVHKGRNDSDLEVIVPVVGQKNQPIIRGHEQRIKRKYVEVMARSHTIRYEQQVKDPSRPEAFVMVEKKIPDYPFDVREDTRRGKKWLDAIYASI